ncbi:MAG: phage tail tape measure protein [Desulfovibrionaceae bacterium]|nr:phage tail tape measure protein [Desulfovibrionaceae bacterium]
MEVFNVFATLSLVDMISGPLNRVKHAMQGVEGGVASLGKRMGNLAIAMAPVALAAGAMLGAFGVCVGVAAGFEDQMAKVGAVSRASGAEMQALEAKARELGATTQFTAVQVGQAEQYLAMAGFTAAENIAALPGVLNLAAATATDLGRAADISSDILGAFGLKAGEMGRVADTLAMTCATANTNMELLGDTMKYVAPVARMAGLSLEETAAMAGLLGNVGIKGSQAGTSLKAMLNKLAAPTKEAQELFEKLGVTVKDSAGNLRSPVTILGEMAASLKNMGTAEQIAALKMVVGEEAIAGFSELIEKGGIGKLEEYIAVINESGGAAEAMAARMNDTLGGSLRSLGSAWESVQITVGKLFLPAVRAAVNGVTGFLRLLDKAAQSPFGAVLLKIVAAISLAVVALTGFSGALWFFSAVGPMIAKALAPAKAAILGLGAPMLAVIAVLGLLYLAYKTNFGGMADYLSDWWNKITLTVKGVMAVFQTLKDGSGQIRGELATQIKAAGLAGLVTTVARFVYRLKALFSGIWQAFVAAWELVGMAIEPVRLVFASLMNAVGKLFGVFNGNEAMGAVSTWEAWGRVLGVVLVAVGAVKGALVAYHGIMTAISAAVKIWTAAQWLLNIALNANPIGLVVLGIAALIAIVAVLVAYWDDIAAWWTNLWDGLLADARVVWDGLCNGVAACWDAIVSGITEFGASILAGVTDAWNAVLDFFSGLSLFESGAKLLDTFIEGLKSMASAVVDSVAGVFAKVREYLPFSDAHVGPLSQLTLSGARMMDTLAEGVNGAQGGLVASVGEALSSVGSKIGDWWQTLTTPASPELPAMSIPEAPGASSAGEGGAGGNRAETAQSGQTINISIQSVNVSGVKDVESFVDSLRQALQAELAIMGA